MPRWKYVANRFLTTIENKAMGTDLSELHSGYRAYSKRLLLTVPFLRNSPDFVFDSELLFQAVALRAADDRGPSPWPLLQRRLVGGLRPGARLRDQDALDRASAICCTARGWCARDKFMP